MIYLAGIFILIINFFQSQLIFETEDKTLKNLVARSLKTDYLELIAYKAEGEVAKEESGLLNLNSIYEIHISGNNAGYVITGTAYACREGGCTLENQENPNSLNDQGKESFDYAVILNAELDVIKVEITDYNATRGSEIMSRPFLRQFTGKSPSRLPFYDRNIDGLSGATISGIAITDSVRLIILFMKKMVEGGQS